MYVEVRTHTVSCAMQEVQTLLPHGVASQYIKLGTACSTGELDHCQTDVSFQYEGIVRTFFFCERTKGDGTGDVGGTVLVLGSAVE